MNLSEFRAWFEGFTENLDGTPNDKQWKRIKKRVSEITPDPTPWPVFVDRYRPYWHETWSLSAGAAAPTTALSAQQNPNTWDSVTAFNTVGQMEAQSMLSQERANG